MSSRAELLLVLGLPPHAGAHEIEPAYRVRRAEAEKRLEQGDFHATAEIALLERVLEQVEGTEPSRAEVEPVAAFEAKKPSQRRSPEWPDREATGSLVCGIAACLVVLWAAYVYRPDPRDPSIDVLNLFQSPVYFLIYLLALAAEMLSYTSFRNASRALLLERRGIERPDLLSEAHVSRARAGRVLGRTAAALAVLLAILLSSSFSRALAG